MLAQQDNNATSMSQLGKIKKEKQTIALAKDTTEKAKEEGEAQGLSEAVSQGWCRATKVY